jgi:hypothetical protein
MTHDDDPVHSTEFETAGEAAAIALSAVPVAGGVMAGIAGAIISRRQNRRLNEFLVTLADNFKILKTQLNNEFLKTDEFQDLAEDLFSKAAETRQQ